ncbi:MAG: hypothetical protein ACQEP4_00905 [Bacillota bacterium]
MKKEGFVLVEILIGFALVFLLASSVYIAMTSSAKSMNAIEKRALLTDHCQRIAETLKVPSKENDEYFLLVSSASDLTPYDCDKLPEGMEAHVRLENATERLQTYVVIVREEERDAQLVATRILQ